MICEPLAYTGAGASPILLLIAAIGLVVVGGVVVLLARRRGRAVTAAMLLLVITAGLLASSTAAAPAHADAVNCPPGNENSLTVVQTSAIEGMAPGVAPMAIAGLVSNNGDDSTHIFAVHVEIVGVIAHPDSVPGACDQSDYILLTPRMPVDRTLEPGGATPFAGAFIVFNDKSVNQDSCKRATVQLLYTANPS